MRYVSQRTVIEIEGGNADQWRNPNNDGKLTRRNSEGSPSLIFPRLFPILNELAARRIPS